MARLKGVPRFGVFYYCYCLPLLPGFACNIHAAFGPPFSQALKIFVYKSSLTERDEDAADAGDPAGDHGEEEDPAPAPLVHGVPAHEVGGHLKLGILHYHLIIKLIIMQPPLPR